PGSPRRDCAASNTVNTISQSSSVICVSMVGLPCRPRSDSMKYRFGNPKITHGWDSVHNLNMPTIK
ncbi:MAG TPA: hypothetical protein VMB73_11105, partial [Acetobacteraceae bacterium]|nr:hypothetical protein [Acetobacteraceae bacterium]